MSGLRESGHGPAGSASGPTPARNSRAVPHERRPAPSERCGIVLPSNLRRAVEGLTVPIRDILKVEYGPVFEPEEVASLTAAFDAALSNLGLVNRKDPITTTVAKVIIQLAKDGERDP